MDGIWIEKSAGRSNVPVKVSFCEIVGQGSNKRDRIIDGENEGVEGGDG